jgi:hypothetical protein
MNIHAIFMIVILIITLFYTYKNDLGIFLLVLLLISVALYIQNIIDTEVNNIKNDIKNVVSVIKNIYSIYNKFDSSKILRNL